MINIDLVPNFEKDDLELIKKIAFGYQDLLSKKRVIKILENYFPNKEILFFNSARGALTFLLTNLKKFSERRSVITQAFSCLVIPNAIKFANLQPVFVDIDKSFNLNLDDLKNKINSDTLALIIQNTFGIPAKIEEILEIARKKNVFVIENLTHSLGAKYKDNYLGNFGDFALLSFNRNKVVSSVIGGALIINNPIFKDELLKEYQKIEEMGKLEIKRLIFGALILIYGKKYYRYEITKRILKFLRELGLTPEMIKKEEKMGLRPKNYLLKFPFELFVLLENQLKKLEKFNEQRIKIASIYLQANLKNFEINEPSEPIFLRFPVFSEKRDQILDYFQKKKVYLGDWYTSVLAPASNNLEIFGYQKGLCPYAEELTKTVFNLPTLIKVEEAHLILEDLKKFLD